jgi:transcriptional regulator with XRE-family HTH domain
LPFAGKDLALGMPKVTPRKAPLRRTFLRQWREYRNLTQAQAADRIGVAQAQLSRVENGQSPYNQAFLEAAAMAYMCEPADLLVRNPLDKSAVWSLIDAVRMAPADTQKTIRAVVESIIKTGT